MGWMGWWIGTFHPLFLHWKGQSGQPGTTTAMTTACQHIGLINTLKAFRKIPKMSSTIQKTRYSYAYFQPKWKNILGNKWDILILKIWFITPNFCTWNLQAQVKNMLYYLYTITIVHLMHYYVFQAQYGSVKSMFLCKRCVINSQCIQSGNLHHHPAFIVSLV
jgi:hypothetical protein